MLTETAVACRPTLLDGLAGPADRGPRGGEGLADGAADTLSALRLVARVRPLVAVYPFPGGLFTHLA